MIDPPVVKYEYISTIEYYNVHAEEYIKRTKCFDVSDVIYPFIERLTPNTRILDLGCGAGRDALTFLSLGFDVLAIDASEKLVAYVRSLNVPVEQKWIEEISFENAFDAVWCCASLMHIKKEDFPDVLNRISRALKPSGLLFASFKHGEGEGWEQGRYFHYLDEEKIRHYLQFDFEILSLSSKSSSLNYNPTTWISMTAQKKKCSTS